MAGHDPAKVLLDLTIALSLGGDCLADIAPLRTEPGVFGAVASDPTVARMINALAAINAARAMARARAGRMVGPHAPTAGIDPAHSLVIDLDAALVTAHSDKEQARPTERGRGRTQSARPVSRQDPEPGDVTTESLTKEEASDAEVGGPQPRLRAAPGGHQRLVLRHFYRGRSSS